MKIRRFVKKRRRRFLKAMNDGMNGAYVRAIDRPYFLEHLKEKAATQCYETVLKTAGR